MKEGDKFITTSIVCCCPTSDLIGVTIPKNKVITYVRAFENGLIFDVDGEEMYVFESQQNYNALRILPYPIERPKTIKEYRELISQIAKDMTVTFGIGVEIEASEHRVKLHIG